MLNSSRIFNTLTQRVQATLFTYKSNIEAIGFNFSQAGTYEDVIKD